MARGTPHKQARQQVHDCDKICEQIKKPAFCGVWPAVPIANQTVFLLRQELPEHKRSALVLPVGMYPAEFGKVR